MVLMFPSCYRHPRESGGPEPAPGLNGLNRGRPLESWRSWIPAFAQGCPGKVLRRQKWRIAASAFVLAGLDPWAFSPRTGSVGIHSFDAGDEDVDTRDKPAQDDFTLSLHGPRTRYA
jgi:hypothetical protein